MQNEVLYLVMQDWVAEPDEKILNKNIGTDINSDDDNDVDFLLKLAGTGTRIPEATNDDKSPETLRQEQIEREKLQ